MDIDKEVEEFKEKFGITYEKEVLHLTDSLIDLLNGRPHRHHLLNLDALTQCICSVCDMADMTPTEFEKNMKILSKHYAKIYKRERENPTEDSYADDCSGD